MKNILDLCFLFICCQAGFAQSPVASNQTLLWKVTGKSGGRPSYIFGTIHMICADNIQLSDSLKSAIKAADNVYLELDMDNIFEMLGIMGKMKMRGDTSLADLLTPPQYDSVKTFFTSHQSMLPFSVLQNYKPLLSASTIMQQEAPCNNQVAMEQLIMQEAKKQGRSIKGLETMAYQLSLFDSIPYQLQAQELLQAVESYNRADSEGAKAFEELASAYRQQNLDTLDAISRREDAGMASFTDLLLYNRNRNWAGKLDGLFANHAYVVAVGAGHLPGPKGLLNLLKQRGYKVEPVVNNMTKKVPQTQL